MLTLIDKMACVMEVIHQRQAGFFVPKLPVVMVCIGALKVGFTEIIDLSNGKSPAREDGI
ncbi:MAG: hypothetical protein NTV43_02325 [Methylococcales bacterium]|nr:hypothetical protein [Methylococcales bacterium]